MLLQLRGVERAAEDAERRGEHTLDKMPPNLSGTVAPILGLVMRNKPCWNSKAMGIHLAHNIRIRLVQLKKNNFIKSTFFNVMMSMEHSL